jgi:hypothetical protein
MRDAGIEVQAFYLPRHRDEPLRPATPAELAAVIDEMVANRDFNHSYATVILRSTDGAVAMLGVGVFAERSVGSLLYQGANGEFYSKGTTESHEDVFYSDFGNARFFPRDSEVGLDAIKSALAEFHRTAGARPTNLAWQVWTDTVH